MAFLGHVFCLAVLYHSHLVIKLCLASLLENIFKFFNSQQSGSAVNLKVHFFDLGIALALFLIENSAWVLPKADWVRVFAEAIGLVTIAILEQM